MHAPSMLLRLGLPGCALAGRGDREAALAVQDALRYRLTRLVTENSWDARPQLKLRVLKLMVRQAGGEVKGRW